MKNYDPTTTEYTGEVFNNKPDATSYVCQLLSGFDDNRFDVDCIVDEMFDCDFAANKFYAKAFEPSELTALLWKYDYNNEESYPNA